MKRAIKKMIIEGTVIGAIGSFVVFASAIECGAPILPCAIGMSVCLLWILIVGRANR